MLVGLLSLSLSLIDPGQAAPPPPECVAAAEACRTLVEYELDMGDRSLVIGGGAVVPWVQDGRLLVFVGESVVVDVEGEKPVVESAGRATEVLDDAQAEALAAIMKGVNDELPRFHDNDALRLHGPRGRTRVSFRQAPGSEEMILTVENGYEGALNYRAAMMVVGPNGAQWAATSVCTVGPGIYSVEHWPHPIVAVALGEFEIAPKDQPVEVVCR
jgi:hypothetical protein